MIHKSRYRERFSRPDRPGHDRDRRAAQLVALGEVDHPLAFEHGAPALVELAGRPPLDRRFPRGVGCQGVVGLTVVELVVEGLVDQAAQPRARPTATYTCMCSPRGATWRLARASTSRRRAGSRPTTPWSRPATSTRAGAARTTRHAPSTARSASRLCGVDSSLIGGVFSSTSPPSPANLPVYAIGGFLYFWKRSLSASFRSS